MRSPKVCAQKENCVRLIAESSLLIMAHASAGGGASEAAGLQRCDRSKITIISTTQPKEGGFGQFQIAKLTCIVMTFNESLQASCITHT